MITKEVVKIFKLMTGEFVIVSESEKSYDNIHIILLQPQQNKSMGLEFIPIGFPLFPNPEISIEKKEFEEKTFIDFTGVKSDNINQIVEMFVKYITQITSGIILPDSNKIIT